MAMHWHFYAFDRAAFDKVFGGGDLRAIEALKDALADDTLFDLPELSLANELLDRVGQQGIDYDELTEDEVDVIDCALFAAFKSSSMSKALRVVPLSNVPLSLGIVQVLRTATTSIRASELYEAMLEGGRRFGQVSPRFCNYLLMDGEDITALLSDAQQYLLKGTASADILTRIDESLVYPLQLRTDDTAGVVAFFS